MSEELNNNVTEETATAAPAAEEAPVESKAKTKFGRKLDNYFGITKEKSTFGTEIVAGIVTFLAMAYILVVNPNAISLFGVNKVPTEQIVPCNCSRRGNRYAAYGVRRKNASRAGFRHGT